MVLVGSRLLALLLAVTLAAFPACTGTFPSTHSEPPQPTDDTLETTPGSPGEEDGAPAPEETQPSGEQDVRSEWPWIVGGVVVAGAIVFAGMIAALYISLDQAYD